MYVCMYVFTYIYICIYVRMLHVLAHFCICNYNAQVSVYVLYVCMFIGVCVADSEEADVAGVSRRCEAQRQVLVCVLSGSPPLHRGR